MRALGLKTIVDFRTEEEQVSAPDKWLGLDSINTVSLPIGHGRFDKMEWVREADEDKRNNQMVKANRHYTLNHIEEYKTFFQLLLNESNYPILFHCTAGKDRTGFAAMLLLNLLGVDDATIMKDYLLTNEYLKEFVARNARQLAEKLKVPEVNLLPMFEARESYLNGASDVIRKEYGDVFNYLAQELSIGPSEVTQIRKILID